jgi:hypothetical protein
MVKHACMRCYIGDFCFWRSAWRRMGLQAAEGTGLNHIISNHTGSFYFKSFSEKINANYPRTNLIGKYFLDKKTSSSKDIALKTNG